MTEKGGVQIMVVMDEFTSYIISALLEMAESNPIIKRIIVFELADASEYEISICYDIFCSTRDIRARELSVMTSKLCDYSCDIVFYDLIGTNLQNEINATGVVAYEKNDKK